MLSFWSKPSIEVSLPGMEHVLRYFDKDNQRICAKIKPGECYVTKRKELITTALGSCVSACVHDRFNQVGGMNHIMFPGAQFAGKSNAQAIASERYGHCAMEYLVNHILNNGGERRHLEVKLFGGASIFRRLTSKGKSNIDFLRDYVSCTGLLLVAEDMGGQLPRKILFDPITGIVRVKRLRTLHNDTITKREQHYESCLEEIGQVHR